MSQAGAEVSQCHPPLVRPPSVSRVGPRRLRASARAGDSAAAGLLLAALVLWPAPRAADDTPVARHVVLVGLDAADWLAIDPLVSAGKLPAFARLKAAGRTGIMHPTPPLVSPIIWTTIATGLPPEEHGILDFMADLPDGSQAPVGSSQRQVPALWNLFSDAGRTVAIVGWWATWPAETVHGVIVSDGLAPQLIKPTALDEAGLVYPATPARLERVRAKIVRPGDLGLDDLAAYVPLTRRELDAARAASATGATRLYQNKIAHLAAAVASSRTYAAIAVDLARTERPDLLAVYIEDIDTVSHLFVDDPVRGPRAIERVYRDADDLLIALANASAPDTVIVVCSDHGFYPASAGLTEDPSDLTGPATAWHRPYGIVAAIEARALLAPAPPAGGPASGAGFVTPLDVAPTVLHLAGLPVTTEMPGRVVTALLPADAASRPIASRPAPPFTPAATLSGTRRDREDEALARLRALGYIGAAKTALGRQNLGEILFREGKYAAAERALRAVVSAEPDNLSARLWLAKSLAAQGRTTEALRAYELAVALPDGARAALVEAVDLALAAGDPARAAALVAKAPADRPSASARAIARGTLSQARGDVAAARREMEAALDADPLSFDAADRLLTLAIAAGRPASALPRLRRAVELAPASPRHLALLGTALLAVRDAAGAEAAFAKALALAPDSGAVRVSLGRALLMQQQTDRAIGTLAPAEASVERSTLLGAAYSTKGRWAEASREFRAAMALDGGAASPDLLNGLGWAQLQLGERQEAARLFAQSLEHEPEPAGDPSPARRDQDPADERHAMTAKRRKTRPRSGGAANPATRVPTAGPRHRLARVIVIVCVAGAAAAWLWTARPWSHDAARPNVLLVTIDTLRWDRLGCYGYSGGATPTLDALARRGTRFETAVAQAPLTAPSHASILTGLTPLRHGVRDNGAFVLPDALPTLASRLKAAGYATAAFISGFPLDHRFGFASGFDTYDDRLPRGAPAVHRSYSERRADATTDRALAWLDEQRARRSSQSGGPGRPWFMWVHYFDPHAAYEPPGEFATRFADRPYDGEVAFVDAQLGRLFQQLDRWDDTVNTLVLVTADHGESLGDHDEETHGVFVYDATVRVPFIVAGPGVRDGLVARVVARGVDVMPTLLDLAGVAPPDHLDGRSLRPALEGGTLGDEPAYVESLMAQRSLGWAPLHALRSAAWKYIDAPQPELYDLEDDPGERRNRIGDQPERASSMARQLEAQMRASATPAAAGTRDRETAERLRALGYLGSASGARARPSGRDPKDGIQLINRLERGVAQAKVDPDLAVRMLQSVLAEDPDVALARRTLALAFVELRQYGPAIVQLRRLQAEGTADADDLLVLSEALRVTGKTDEARTLLAEAARLDPRSPEPGLTEARVLLAEHKLAEAKVAYQRVLAMAPGNPEALVGLGDVALEEGDPTQAGGYFERARARDPEDGVAALRLAVVRAREGHFDEALPLFEQVVRQSPTNGEALAGLAASLARTGRPAEAVPYFERALQAGLHTPALLNGLGFARLESGNQEGALEALRASLALRPDQPRVAQVVRQLSETLGRSR